MKMLFAFLLMLTMNAAMAGHSSPVPDYVLGYNNGCSDGAIQPFAAAQHAYTTIMYNQAISIEYREAYDLGWSTCAGAAGDLVDTGISDLVADCMFFGICTYPPGTYPGDNPNP